MKLRKLLFEKIHKKMNYSSSKNNSNNCNNKNKKKNKKVITRSQLL